MDYERQIFIDVTCCSSISSLTETTSFTNNKKLYSGTCILDYC